MNSTKTVSVSIAISDVTEASSATRSSHFDGQHTAIHVGSCTGSCLMALGYPDAIEFAARTLQFVIELETQTSNFYAADLDCINAVDNAINSLLNKYNEREIDRKKLMGGDAADKEEEDGPD